MINGKIIAIIGAPRSGKSFLASKLAAKLGFELFLEGHDGGVPMFLEKDIQNNQNSLRRILWFRNRQVAHFLEARKMKSLGKGIVLDTFWIDNQMYIDVLLNGYDADVAGEMMQIDQKTLEWPEVIVYLKNSELKTKEFIALGGREFDADEDFYQKTIVPLQEKYEKILALAPSATQFITIDRSGMDFEQEEDLDALIKQINL